MEKKQNQTPNAQEAILMFYESLTDREKLIVSAFDWLCTAKEEPSSSGIDAKLREVVDSYTLEKIPAEERFLHGIRLASQALLS